MANGNSTTVIKISFKNLLNEIVDKFHMAPPIWQSHQSIGQKFRASLEIQDNAIEGGKIKLYSGMHKKKIEAEQEVAKIAIEHLKNFLDFEVEDFNYQDKELYRFHLEQVDFAFVKALQENDLARILVGSVETK